MKFLEQSLVFSEAQALVAVLGVGAALLVYLTRGRAWMKRWHERRLRRSEVFSEVQDFMHGAERVHRQLSDELCRVHKSVLSLTLFDQTTSQRVHEQQLEAGREYLELGGNGPAKAQYEVLYQDYLERNRNDDWSYLMSNQHN